MKLTWNAPVTLSLVGLSTLVLVLTAVLGPWFTEWFFVLYPDRGWLNPLSLLSMVTYPLGHASWNHLAGNMTFLLLLGPLLEEKYGSKDMAIMMAVTTVIIAIVNNLFFSTGLLGASGLVFMVIVLSSFTNLRQGAIPVTAVLVAILFLGKEFLAGFSSDTISQMAHIMGGVCGLVFGFLATDSSKPHA
jgi:membrane associated rhomboid family serine protease